MRGAALPARPRLPSERCAVAGRTERAPPATSCISNIKCYILRKPPFLAAIHPGEALSRPWNTVVIVLYLHVAILSSLSMFWWQSSHLNDLLIAELVCEQ